MAATQPKEYKTIKVAGPVSAERVSRISWPCRIILIMGPTGAGKSTFIEALGLGGIERISSNRLEGCTQTVSTFRMHGITEGHYPIYLVDSPGFADTKISEMAIVSMLQKWKDDNRGKAFDRIFYLIPITQVRFPGSQRQVLKTFQALTGVHASGNITIITTLWDTIWGERATTRAEGTYKQLESIIWKDFIEQGARILRFYNTQDSAFSVLDDALSKYALEFFHLDSQKYSALQESPFAASLYTDLQDRVQNLQSEIPNIQTDLEYAEAQDDHLLRSVLLPRLEEAENLLQRFQGELQKFGRAPDPVTVYPPPPALAQPDVLRSDDTLARQPEVHEARLPHQAQRGPLVRALDFVLGCGFCGKGVETYHET